MGADQDRWIAYRLGRTQRNNLLTARQSQHHKPRRLPEAAEGHEGGRNTMTIYDVSVTRDGKWWMVAIPALGGLTQARRFSEAADMAREYIAVTLDVPIETLEINVTVESVGDLSEVERQVMEILAARAKAEELDRTATRQATELAKSLRERGVPLRDIGAIMHLSYQRVDQLVKS